MSRGPPFEDLEALLVVLRVLGIKTRLDDLGPLDFESFGRVRDVWVRVLVALVVRVDELLDVLRGHRLERFVFGVGEEMIDNVDPAARSDEL